MVAGKSGSTVERVLLAVKQKLVVMRASSVMEQVEGKSFWEERT
jgi:hypothetical protein